MSFLEDIKNALDNDLLDAGEPHSEWEMVEDEYVDSSRWAEHWRAVYKRRTVVTSSSGSHPVDEYVAVEYSVPATEYQEVDEPYDDVYVVRPREVVKVLYEKE